MEEEEGKPTPRCCRKAKGWTAGLSHVHTDPEVGGATDQVRNQRGMRSAPKSERDKDGMGRVVVGRQRMDCQLLKQSRV